MFTPDLSGFYLKNGDMVAPLDPLRTAQEASAKRSISRFRFLQSSDFRLDTPCCGVADLPTGIRDRFVEARYIAAERVFDAAIEYQVDFVILSGGLLDAQLPGLRGPWFLAEQFRRLAAHGINVYWSGATFETRGRWPAHIDLPPNVHRLTAGPTGMLHGRNGHPIVRLLTLPAGSEVQPVATPGLFVIAVQPRVTRIPDPLQRGVDYWAFGGQPEHETVQVGDVVAHFAGSPQGRSPEEIGRHACSLVDVDETGGVQIHPVPTDVVRWYQRRICVDGETSWSALEQQLDQQLTELHAESDGEISLVTWTVSGAGAALQRLLTSGERTQLVHRLNAEAVRASQVVWTVQVSATADPAMQAVETHQPSHLEAFLEHLTSLPQGSPVFDAVPEGFVPSVDFVHTSSAQTIQGVVNEGVHWLGAGAGMRRRETV